MKSTEVPKADHFIGKTAKRRHYVSIRKAWKETQCLLHSANCVLSLERTKESVQVAVLLKSLGRKHPSKIPPNMAFKQQKQKKMFHIKPIYCMKI